MPDQFVVPQFLDVEAKIIGPITGRQFAILLVTLLGDFIIYRIFLNLLFMIGLGLPLTVLGLAFAFAKVNGQPLHYLALNMLQTMRRPFLRVWDKKRTDQELKELLKKEEEPPEETVPQKASIEGSRLSELTLLVNTGGVYAPEDESVYSAVPSTIKHQPKVDLSKEPSKKS